MRPRQLSQVPAQCRDCTHCQKQAGTYGCSAPDIRLIINGHTCITKTPRR